MAEHVVDDEEDDLSDDCDSTMNCPSCDTHYKGCPMLDMPTRIG